MNTKTLLVGYFSQYMELSEEKVQLILNQDIIGGYDKHDLLLKEGQIAKEYLGVLKGCAKRYFLENGKEKILE